MVCCIFYVQHWSSVVVKIYNAKELNVYEFDINFINI